METMETKERKPKRGAPRRKSWRELYFPIAVSFAPEDLAVIEELAEEMNITRSQVIRDAVRHYLECLGVRRGRKEEAKT